MISVGVKMSTLRALSLVVKRTSCIKQVLGENQPHLFLITETQLKSNTGINIEGYTFFSRKREGRAGGGVAIFVRNDIRSNITVHYSEQNIEIIQT